MSSFGVEIYKQNEKGRRKCFLYIPVSIQCIRILPDDGEIGLEEKTNRFLLFFLKKKPKIKTDNKNRKLKNKYKAGSLSPSLSNTAPPPETPHSPKPHNYPNRQAIESARTDVDHSSSE